VGNERKKKEFVAEAAERPQSSQRRETREGATRGLEREEKTAASGRVRDKTRGLRSLGHPGPMYSG